MQLKLLPVEKVFAADRAPDVLQLLSLQGVLPFLQRPPRLTLTRRFPGFGREMFMVKPAVSLDIEEEGKSPLTVGALVWLVQLGLSSAAARSVSSDWSTSGPR